MIQAPGDSMGLRYVLKFYLFDIHWIANKSATTEVKKISTYLESLEF